MNDIILTRRYVAPCGTLLLGTYNECLCLCDWEHGRHHKTTIQRLERMLKARCHEGESTVNDTAARMLDEYFKRQRQTFDIPLLLVGSNFQQRVWNELQRIPYATVISYGQQARGMGCPQAVRAVAGANGANPISIIVPCHRVVGSDNKLTGYGGGIEIKRFLLNLEGVEI